MKSSNPLKFLQRLSSSGSVVERCEFCSLALPGMHRHVLEVVPSRVICACDPCALRFENVIGRYRLIPRDIKRLPDFELSDGLWEELALPINLAFFIDSTPRERTVALYPSPAGITESLLTFNAWSSITEQNPALGKMEPDVTALLVNRLGPEPAYYLAPIDKCFELAGIIRIHWQGLHGGSDVWREVDAFFAAIPPALILANSEEAINA